MSESDEISIYELFRMEAEERSESLQRLLLGLHDGEGGPAALHVLMREAHSLKGAARIAGFGPAVRLTHAMEDRFLAAKRGEQIQEAQLDALLSAVDFVRHLASLPEEAGAMAWAESQEPEIKRLCEEFAAAATAEQKPVQQPEKPPEPAALPPPAFAISTPASGSGTQAAADPSAGETTFRLGSVRFDQIVAHSADTVVKAQILWRTAAGLHKTYMRLDNALSRFAKAMENPEENSDGAKAVWETVTTEQQRLRDFITEIQEAAREAQGTAEGLQHEVLRARLRPLAEIVPRMQRLVRSVGAELGKRVRLEIVGEGTEVDTDILERLSGPLEHLIRNSLDHGLETPEERRAAAKAEEGRLRLFARQHNGRLVITLSDDGCGIDIAAVRNKAQLLGLVFPGVTAELSDDEVLQFLFLPGFSTRQAVSEISGRGFGMDAVQTMVQDAGGAIRIETTRAIGTTIHLTLPISRSVVRVMRVAVEDEVYALPTDRLSRIASVTVQVDARGRSSVEGSSKRVPIVSLSEVLSGAGARVTAGPTLAIFLLEESGGESGVAISIDRTQGEALVAFRQLDARLGRRGVFAGVTLDEGGVPMLIIEPDDLLSTALGAIRRRRAVVSGDGRRCAVLVADDSATLRQMLRRVLAGAGYRVTVATHGAEAWALLQSQAFDLLISDVDMPEMTGIELTERLRANVRLNHLPVVLLSYKGREEDRRRGLAAGADVYLSKGEFEESHFLKAVSDLLGSSRMERSGV